MDIGLIIQLLSGAVGGNIVGALAKNLSLGTFGNSIAGILGGGIGAFVLQYLGIGPSEGALDIGSIASEIGSGAAGGGILMVIVGLLKSMFAKA